MSKMLDYVYMIGPLSGVEYNPDLTREVRAYLGLNQHEFAVIIGTHPSVVARWESGKGAPNSSSLGRVFALYSKDGAKTVPVWRMGNTIISLNIESRLSD